jgi:hypothetical protein
VNGEGGGGGAFAGLAGAIEEDLAAGGEEQLALPGVGRQALAHEDLRGVEGQGQEDCGVHGDDSNRRRGGCEAGTCLIQGQETLGIVPVSWKDEPKGQAGDEVWPRVRPG